MTWRTVATGENRFVSYPAKGLRDSAKGVSVFFSVKCFFWCGVLYSLQHEISPIHCATAWQHTRCCIAIDFDLMKHQNLHHEFQVSKITCTSNRSFGKLPKNPNQLTFFLRKKSTATNYIKNIIFEASQLVLFLAFQTEDSRYPNTFSEFMVGLGWISKWWCSLGNSRNGRFFTPVVF